MKSFEPINKGYNSVFKNQMLSIGLVVPIENYSQQAVPTMQNHLERVKRIDELGFKALWLRDVPFNVPSFGDVGQMYDPFTYLGYLAGHTKDIALGIASIALPLHHPVHIAKSAATIDQLSDGRMILGVASGDRPTEYPSTGIDFESRGERFKEAFDYIRHAAYDFPTLETKSFGTLNGQSDILPKSLGQKIPILVTGHSRQTVSWIAEHSDGWMYYPRNAYMQKVNIEEWHNSVSQTSIYAKPFMQPLYVDLHQNDDYKPQPIHLGFRIGTHYLIEYLEHLKNIGVNHVAINLRFNNQNIEQTLDKLSANVLPHFHNQKQEKITS